MELCDWTKLLDVDMLVNDEIHVRTHVGELPCAMGLTLVQGTRFSPSCVAVGCANL